MLPRPPTPAKGRPVSPKVIDLNPTQLAIALAGAVTLAGYVAFILVPACSSYGRVWEKVAAGFLSLFVLASLLTVGAALGLAIVWSYDRFA